MPKKVRIDKWIWAVRIYKTRTMATNACRSGRVKINGKPVKASGLIEEGMEITVNKKGKHWVVKCLSLPEKRISPAQARTCYEDLSPLEENKVKDRTFYNTPNEFRDKGSGRPTKKERRLIDSFKGINKKEK